MDDQDDFGGISAKKFKIGDIVCWSTWNSKLEQWEEHLGVLIDIKNELKSNRLVLISTVMPLKNDQTPIELFTFSLKLISSSSKEQKS